MKIVKLSVAGLVLPLLAACAAGPDIDATKAMPNTGSDFNKGLQAEYAALAVAEAEEWDTEDAVYFNNKALAAAKGEDVQPQPLSERKITGDAQWELEAARQGLRASLLSGSKDYAPWESARAQAMFDCWIQEQEENNQQEHIDACRLAFDEALAIVEQKRPPLVVPARAPAAPAAIPGPYVVYFDFDSFDLSATGAAVIKEAAAAGMAAGATSVTVTGHTDSAGNTAYNQGLSRARAGTVGNQLMIEGIARSMVQREYSGESDLAVQTGDNAKEARNRRVTITFSR